MKTIIHEIKNFIISQHPLHWLFLMLFCSLSVYMNYGYGLQNRIDALYGYQAYFSYTALYAVHTIFAYLLYSLFYSDFRFWLKPGFLTLLFLSFFIFAFRATIYQHATLIASISVSGQKKINQLVFNDIFRILYLFIPVIIIWFIADYKRQNLYGFSLKNHRPKTYWIMLFCMIPLIISASFLSDFLAYYPRFQKILDLGPPTWKVWLYELCYGLDFTSIEFFFRGFMVMAFAKYVGIHSILPMASFYLTIHYGKPMGEAISSFFGGTILGIISYQSGSIFGGIMVHAGVAWLMEIGGYLGNYIKSI